jgi:hypothetical protein
MSGWLTTATNAFRKKVDAPAQTFEIRCGCGKSLSGERTRAEQTATCPACKSALFVLPASVYPIPRSPVQKKVVRAPRPDEEDETSATATKSTKPDPADVGGPRRRPRSSAAPSRVATAAPEPSFAERVQQAFEPANLDRLRRKLLTPLRLVLLGVALVIVATIWWIGHLRALDRARDTLASVPRQAEESLQEGDAPEAARKFALLRHAVDLLGRDDPQSRRWRQLARETAAIADLAAAPLHDILLEAAEAPDRSAWANQFRVNYRDGWVLIDAPVSRATDGSDTARLTVDFPLVVGEHLGRLVAELPALEPAVAADGSARRVIFAAQLADCRLESGPDPIWRIELRPETGFLWTGAETYQALGMPPDESSSKTLAGQAQLLGIEP